MHIDSAEVPNDPEATIEKAQNIKKAAMAPADPSWQDLKVAREASRMESKARKELVENDNEDNNSIQQKLNSTYNSENFKSNYDVFVWKISQYVENNYLLRYLKYKSLAEPDFYKTKIN